MQSPFYKQNKITKVDISLKQLLDVDTTNELYYRRTDNIQPNQVLTSYTNSLRRDAFRFKYLTDLIQAGSGVTITELDGVLTISASGGGGGTGTVTSIDVDGGTGISVSPAGPITTSGTFTVTNTAPDQTVVLNNGTGISVTGTYPNFTIASTITGGSGLQHAIASGTDTYTATITGVTSYAEGDAYLIRFTNGNTTGCTLNINGLGARTLYRNNDGVLIGGDIIANGDMLCVYDTSLPGFRVIGTAPNTLLAYVTNDDSVTLTKGMAVYAFSGTGDRMTVKRASNTADATSAQTVGLVLSSSIAANQKGLIMMQGLLDGLSILPTSTYNDGDPIYLGATAGSITKTKPYAPNHLVYLGVVTTASPGSAGRMYVKVQNGYELDELHNVQAQTPSLKDTLWYDNAVSPAQWKTASIPTILGYTPVPDTRTITIDGTTLDLSANRTFATTGSRQSASVNMVSLQVGPSTNTFTSIATVTPSAFNASEIIRQSVFGTAVTFTRLTFVTQGVPQSATGSLTIVLRVNGVDSALSFTVLPLTVVGVFTVTGTVAVGATDRVSIRCQNAATVNSMSIVAITTTFTI